MQEFISSFARRHGKQIDSVSHALKVALAAFGETDICARDITAITVNRWSHGYSYVANSLFDRDDYTDVLKEARRTVGRVAIANTDAGGDAWAHYAIDQAERAVRELVS